MPLDDNSSYLSTVCFRKSGLTCQDWFKYTITARHGPNWRVPSTDTTLLLFPECLAAGKPGIDRVFP
ncbi:hypothetical protein WG66_002362, partial [Moniliophthora roreri]